MAIINNNIISKNNRKIFLIKHGNRLVIAALTLTGLYWDGYQGSDLLFACACILWVWLPEFDKLEENCFCKKTKRNHIDNEVMNIKS